MLNLTATAVGGQTLADLEALLHGESVLGAWELAVTSGYTAGEPVYLSFDVGPAYSRDDVTIWHYDGATWTEYDAWDLTCDGQYASFIVTGLSGYAVTGTIIPEPAAVALLLGLALALLRRPKHVHTKAKASA